MSLRSRQSAFTLLEMLLAVAIVGVLIGVALPAYQESLARGNNVIAKAHIVEIAGNIDDFFRERKRYPNSLEEAGISTIIDPWGNPYRYLNIAATVVDSDGERDNDGGDQPRKDRNLHRINSDYDLYSVGADGMRLLPLTAAPSRDDIIRANNGAFIGLAEECCGNRPAEPLQDTQGTPRQGGRPAIELERRDSGSE